MKIFMWFAIALGAVASFFAHSMNGEAKELSKHLGRLLILEAQVALMRTLIDNKEKEIAVLASLSKTNEIKNLSQELLSLAGMQARRSLWTCEVFEENQRVRLVAESYYRSNLPKSFL